mmetsp:Transcript_28352/g.47662  ORF Transcript_28352/g.47662 Transcript_28352/m.47662 type:complete len:627 (-) Transcript_28352:203-2083(-)|eukprot:CAMPEP_0174960610 /NCGR_PEP_ID=MMETSP0004_2-20121128/3794_1 /TAXON_ID=420556 /ORGANISM="Ochromonas sp., Strain CCMP1393" /LENGTH=626 /DNA_ID=CAMNT_0016208991 /DNA_START=48 /DNA_END=1928 /DNA_ORIENTATION=-
MNPNAAVWTPGGFTPPAAPVASTSAPPMPPVTNDEVSGSEQKQGDGEGGKIENDDEEAIDENDPLWQATLKVTEGDRERAMKMLEDPDSLMQYPEIRSLLEGGAGSGGDADDADDWEKAGVAEVADNVANIQISGEKAGTSSSPSPSPSKVAAQAAGEDNGDAVVATVAAEDLEEGDPREHLNLVFIGHVDAGKSTLSGSILYLMGKVDTRTIERFEREAKQRNRESWFLAFIMDTSEEERAKGKTVEVGRAHFETDNNRYTILDAPGHKNYVPNMIAGAAQADVGVLVISARKGEFETGFEKGGQTREHALLARTLGVAHLVVVINKMDDPTVEWDQGRYEECVTKLKPYLKQVGYVIKKDVKFVPISGLSGDNVRDEVPESKCAWWKKMYTSGGHNTTTPTLISTLDALRIEGRNADGPLRLPCLDRYFERGCIVLGKVESGTIKVGDDVVIMPTRKKTKIDEVCIGEQRVRSAKPGENVLLKLPLGVEDIQKGYVLSFPTSLCPAVREIKVQLALVDMLEHRPIFTPGYEAVMHVHTVEIEITCARLISVIDKGKAMVRPYARTGQVCTARLAMPLNTCMETFERMPSLGRLTLRDEGKTIAIGKILELYREKPGAAAGTSGK